MAKIKGTKFLRRMGGKRIHSEVTVSTQPGGKLDNSFYGCVRIGGLRHARLFQQSAITACAYGRTPRKAIAKALTKAARGVRGRRGVFGGT